MITANVFNEFTTNHVAFRNPTILIVDTTKLSTGSTLDNQFKIPVTNYLFHPFIVNWGDGNSDVIMFWNSSLLTHTYTTSGLYQIEITASDTFAFAFSNTNDRLKLLKVVRFGQMLITTGQFRGCANLQLNEINEVPNLMVGNTFSLAFANTAFTSINKVELWDVNNLKNMNNAFQAALFNQDISMWNFNKDVTLTSFMNGKTPANYNAAFYDSLLQKWASVFIGTGRTESVKNIGMGTIKYTIAGKPYRDALVADGWTITDGGMI